MDDLREIISTIEKHSLKAYPGNDEELVVERIPFNIPQLDVCIGGGIPRGRISELVGEFSTGKSLLCQKLIGSAQNMGIIPVYMNIENKYDPEWFAKTSVDVDKMAVVQGNIGEHVFDAVVDLIGKKVGLIIVDSIAALVPMAEDEDDMCQQTIGLQARMLSKGFRKIISPLSVSKTAVVFTNQLRCGIGAYATDTYPGGRSQYFYSSLTLHIRRGEWITESRNGVELRKGFRIECRTVKNTVAPPWRTCSIPFVFTTGQIDVVATLCEMALDMGVIEKSGAWYTMHNKERVQGWDKMLECYRTSTEMLKGLSVAISAVE